MADATWVMRCLLAAAVVAFLAGMAQVEIPGTSWRINWIALGLFLVTLTMLIRG